MTDEFDDAERRVGEPPTASAPVTWLMGQTFPDLSWHVRRT